MTNPYDIEEAFAAIEEELIESMIRNMMRHKAEEDDEGIQWEMWQAKQLEALEKYKKANRKKFSKEFDYINQKMEELIKEANAQGMMEQELEILQAIKNGYRAKKAPDSMQAEFFKLNERKLEALINATTNDMQKAETAILRMADDKYRQIIYNAQVYANTGAGTYEKAVDMATKDMLTAGLNCVEYANGARHTLKDYADMAIRTASKRAYLQGEGVKRQEWGISTVIVNKRGGPCPKCLPFCGKILIDDVWSGGTREDGSYPLMSKAIAAGLYHPRCKDSHTTYFEGISTTPDGKYTRREIEKIVEDYRREQKQQYAKRQAEKFERLEKYSLDSQNQSQYSAKSIEWKNKLDTNDKRIADLEKQFSQLTEGYSYADFIKDFGSIEVGFEGASTEDIRKAKMISNQIEALREKSVKAKTTKTIHTRQESIEMFKMMGIEIKADSISDEVLSKYADFITGFENKHSGFFSANKQHLKRISIVDNIKGVNVGGIYREKTNSIEIKASRIISKQGTGLSKSDDFELHILAHEYGHYIADALEKTCGITKGDVVQDSILRYFDGDIFKSTKDLKDCLSSYGSTSYDEAFAEAFAEAYTCKEPRKFAEIFKEELEKHLLLKKVSKAVQWT